MRVISTSLSLAGDRALDPFYREAVATRARPLSALLRSPSRGPLAVPAPECWASVPSRSRDRGPTSRRQCPDGRLSCERLGQGDGDDRSASWCFFTAHRRPTHQRRGFLGLGQTTVPHGSPRSVLKSTYLRPYQSRGLEVKLIRKTRFLQSGPKALSGRINEADG